MAARETGDAQMSESTPDSHDEQGSADPAFPYDDRRDFEDASRGFIATIEPGVIRGAAGEWSGTTTRSGSSAGRVRPR